MTSTPSSDTSFHIVDGFTPGSPQLDIGRWQDEIVESQRRGTEYDTAPIPVPPPASQTQRESTASSTLRTLEDIRDQAATEIAVKAIMKATIYDGVKTCVKLTMSHHAPEQFLRLIAERAASSLEPSGPFLFAFYTASPTPPSSTELPHNTLVIVGSELHFVSCAKVLTDIKFTGRVLTSTFLDEGRTYSATILDPSATSSLTSSHDYPPEYDLPAITDVILKSARKPLDPSRSPPGSHSIDVLLSLARASLQRVSPHQAYSEMLSHDNGMGAPVVLVDIRPQSLREEYGEIPGALIVERNVLEWRFDPRCEARLPIATRYDLRIIIFCQEGYASSLAARDLQKLGLLNATDIIGGFRDWKEADLPVQPWIPRPRLYPLP